MNKVWSVCCLVGAALCVQSVGGGEYVWNGGVGRWSDPANWDRSGVPSGDDLAVFPANAAWTVQVKADASTFRMNSDAASASGSLTFAIDPGVTLALDQMRVRASSPMTFGVTGGGTFALTNQPFGLGGSYTSPVKFLVSGGSTFAMPKAAGSGLYVGRLEGTSSENLFHVTGAGSSAIISNAVCIGKGYDIDKPDNQPELPGSHMIVDDGAFLYGGVVVFIGRGSNFATLAVTNATVEADRFTCGISGSHNWFGGSNAVVRTPLLTLPDESNTGRTNRLEFVDSELNVTDMRLNAGGFGNEAVFRDCRANVRVLRAGFSDGQCGRLRFEGGTLNCNDIYCGDVGVGMLRSPSNNVLRIEGTTVVSTNNIVVGNAPRSIEDGYEQVGGSLTAPKLVVGCDGARRSFARLRAVDLHVGEIRSGNVVNTTNGPSHNARIELADMTVGVSKLVAGCGGVDSVLCCSNCMITATNVTTAVLGETATASGNELLLIDSTYTQNSTAEGGNIFIGGDRNTASMSNTLHLVRSTLDYNALALKKGDVILGYNGNSRGNRVVMEDGSVFNYDRAWMAVGQDGKENVWELHGGSKIEAADSYLVFGNVANASGNGLLLDTGSSVNVKFLDLKGNGSWISVAGTGNVIRASDSFSVAPGLTGCSFRFRLNADSAGGTPMLTSNRALPYSSTAPIKVDVAEAGIGQHVLVSSEVALAAPVKGVNYEIQNQPLNLSAHVRLSPDGCTLSCSVAPAGTLIIMR